MKKGKGYPSHVKDSAKSFGDAYAQDVTGGRNIRSVLNEWDKDSWEAPKSKGGSQFQMDIWDEVVKELGDEIQQLRITLGNGTAEDYAHYRQIVGSIQSLEWARTNINDIIKKRTYGENED